MLSRHQGIAVIPGSSVVSPLRAPHVFLSLIPHTHPEDRSSGLSERMCTKCSEEPLAHRK